MVLLHSLIITMGFGCNGTIRVGVARQMYSLLLPIAHAFFLGGGEGWVGGGRGDFSVAV